jgi:hypothetical protein
MNILFGKDDYNAHEFRLNDFLYFFNDFNLTWGFLAPWRQKLNIQFVDPILENLKYVI